MAGRRDLFLGVGLTLAAALAVTLVGCASPGPASPGSRQAAAPKAVAQAAASEGSESLGPQKAGMVALRRVNESQYRQTIADIYGTDIDVAGRFEPDQRRDGLMAVGSAELSISSGGVEQYLSMGRSIADQVLDDKRRAKFAPCKPADEKAPDDACTTQFVKAQGRSLFRRPLKDSEVAPRVALANAAAAKVGSYQAGLKLAFVSLLTAPEFLFRVETAEADPARPGQVRLDAYTKAARLSYLLWNTTPDEELLKAAETGALHTQAGLDAQVDRLVGSPRLERGVRAFFSDMLQFSRFENTIKDGKTFPKYSFAIAEAAQEQTLRTLVNHLITKDGDYRDVFTTPDTFINRPLAALYDVPYLSAADWTPYKLEAGADQAGIVTQAAFLAMFSHPGRTSPTKRGVALHEVFLCDVMPLPADNVDFTLINDTNNGVLKTVRARLMAHATNPTCAACHNLTDPLGLALERFDSIGQQRVRENGDVIDVSSQLDGVKFDGAKGLGQVLRANERAPGCLVRNVFSYGVGRLPKGREAAYLESQKKAFAQSGYKFRPLLKSIAESPDFYNVVLADPPKPAEPKPEIADSQARLAGGLQ